MTTTRRRRVLVVESYYSGSHRAWAEGLTQRSNHDSRLVTLPARWWRWRMRGGAVTLADRITTACSDGWLPDVVLVGDMVDLPALKALTDRSLAHPAWVLYFHESQLTYPDSPQLDPDIHYAFTNWMSAVVADEVWFNSGYHHRVFFEEVARMLRGFPDFPHTHLVGAVEARSRVVPVGVDLSWIPTEPPPKASPPLLLWNHRWEHDKQPKRFVDAVLEVAGRGIDFRVAVCGENFRTTPTEFDQLQNRIPGRLVQFGHAERDRYRDLLLDTSVVVSTALQEFFGIAVVEATAAGALPLVPPQLSYPWLIPEEFHTHCLTAEDRLVDRLTDVLTDPNPHLEKLSDLAGWMHRFSWNTLIPEYDEALEGAADSARSGGRGR